MTLEEGCAWVALAAVDGIEVLLLSSDGFFGTDGVMADDLPDPTTVQVDGAFAGEISIDPDRPC